MGRYETRGDFQNELWGRLSNSGQGALGMMLKEKLQKKQQETELQNAIALMKEKAKAEVEFSPEMSMIDKLTGGDNKVSTILGGEQLVQNGNPNVPILDKQKLLRGLISKKFNVPYAELASPEEKQQIIQEKAGEAKALEDIKPLSADAAGKLAMVTQAESDLNEAENLLFPNGKFSGGMAAQTNFPGGGLPWTEGRQAYSKVLNAVNAKLRIETGAQANPSEVKNILQRFMPTARDTDTTAKDKFRRLKEFMTSTKSMIDPMGRFSGKAKSQYQQGQTIVKGGKTYQVTGFDSDGEPLVDLVR